MHKPNRISGRTMQIVRLRSKRKPHTYTHTHRVEFQRMKIYRKLLFATLPLRASGTSRITSTSLLRFFTMVPYLPLTGGCKLRSAQIFATQNLIHRSLFLRPTLYPKFGELSRHGRSHTIKLNAPSEFAPYRMRQSLHPPVLK